MGRFTLPLAERGLRIEGLDLSPVLLQRLRGFDGGRYDIPLHCADILEAPTALHGKFDAVVGFFTLHHLHDLRRSFRAVARLLRPGGRVAFLEPNAYNPLFYAQIVLTAGMTWRGDGGIVRMRPPVVLGALREAGFTRPALRRFGFFPPFLSDTDWGARTEAVLERFPPWRGILPFQLFRADLP
jgi:SAM-dependent methyltransferase